jgi:hypothetical protein
MSDVLDLAKTGNGSTALIRHFSDGAEVETSRGNGQSLPRQRIN